MNPRPFHQKTLDALGVLICGAAYIGIARNLEKAQEFFWRVGFDFPIVGGVFTTDWTKARLTELNRDEGKIEAVILQLLNWDYFLDKPELFEPTLNRLQLILAPAGWTVEMDGISPYLRRLPPSFQLLKTTVLPMQPTPEFGKICDDDVWIKVLRARWDEAERCIAADAPVMAIVALGSILEGALRATADRFPREANQADKAPKDAASGRAKPFRDWTFFDFIQVAQELGWIGNDTTRLGQAVREYRNLVHPAEQVKAGEFPTQGSARVCREAVLTSLKNLIEWIETQD